MTKKVCILGIGYIGLPTAVILADAGYNVVGVDINKDIIDNLNKGQTLIEEPCLKEMVENVVNNNKLRASLTPDYADIFIITVPTPITKEKKADMSNVIKAMRSILPFLKRGNTIILESTSPVGTTEELIVTILKESGYEIGKEIFVGYSPERVMPGKIIEELINNNRIIGGINKESTKKIEEFYSTFVKGELSLTDSTTAEMCKLMENTYRDVNIALANELAQICEKTGINVWEVIELSNKHPRVNIHQPGPGVGGHCLAVDPWFIIEKQPDLSKIIQLAREKNDSMPNFITDKIEDILRDVDGQKKVTILGVTYKPDINDLRESPIIEIIKLLEKKNYKISIYDPHIIDFKYLEDDLILACDRSDLLILGVGHSEFKNINFEAVKNVMRNKSILDTRNFFDESDTLEFDIYRFGDGGIFNN